MADRRRLRATFEEVPELYERTRPSYPAELFDDLVSFAGLEVGSRVLEIGCGTGQATLPLAGRGLEVVCVELGERLAAAARRKLAGFPRVEVVHAVFEEWEASDESFDAVVAFTAFHWVDPEVKYAKAARLLRPGGCLAVAETDHVLVEGATRSGWRSRRTTTPPRRATGTARRPGRRRSATYAPRSRRPASSTASRCAATSRT